MVPFNGLAGIEDRVLSVLVTLVVFSAASGLSLLALIVFGVRAGLMAPKATQGMAPASSLELLLFLGSAFLGLVAVLLLVFLGLAENDVGNQVLLLVVALAGLGGLLFMAGAAMALLTIRRVRRPA